MKVLIDGQPLLGNRSGIGRYTKSLVDHLRADNKVQLKLIFNQIWNKNKYKDVLDRDFLIPPEYRNTYYPYKIIRRLMTDNFLYRFPIDLFEHKHDDGFIYHATNFITYPTVKAKNVITIHDLAFMLYPETTDQKIYRHHMNWLPFSIEKADHIIADSYHTKQDIMRLLSVPDDKITVVHLAADEQIIRESNPRISEVKNTYSLPQSYILYVGTLEPRKNLSTLIESFSMAKQKYGIRDKLVIVGAKGWKYDPIFEKIRALKCEDDVIFTGYISDIDLPAIYSGASLFCFPSLYEGFGIPILEAMQCQVPVIASDVSSIPEVVGDGGVLIEPFDVDQWAEKIAVILHDPSRQLEMAERGLQQAMKFTWKKTANETYQVYRLVTSTNRSQTVNNQDIQL